MAASLRFHFRCEKSPLSSKCGKSNLSFASKCLHVPKVKNGQSPSRKRIQNNRETSAKMHQQAKTYHTFTFKGLLDAMDPAALQNLQLHRLPLHIWRLPTGPKMSQDRALHGATLQGVHQMFLEEKISQVNLGG